MADLSYAFDGNKAADPSARRRVAEAMVGSQQMPQDIGQGLAALGNALYQRQQMQKAAFPPPPSPLPGQQQPSFMNGLLNKFGFNNGGSAY
jgi:hypothetical protein